MRFYIIIFTILTSICIISPFSILQGQPNLNRINILQHPSKRFSFQKINRNEFSNEIIRGTESNTYSNLTLYTHKLLKYELFEELIDLVNEDSISTTIQDLQNFQTRYEYTLGRNAAADYLYYRFQKYGLEVLYDPFQFTAPLLWTAISQMNTNKLWIVGGNGIILESSDKGRSWIARQRDVGDYLNHICFIDSLRGWCTGSSGDIYKTIDGGKTWAVLSTGRKDNLGGIAFVDSLHGWVSAFEAPVGKILTTEDGGLNWTLQLQTTETDLWDIHFTTKDSGCAVGSNGIVAITFNGGKLWELKKISNADLMSVDFVDSKHGWIAGGEYAWPHPTGYIYKTSDGGKTWSEVYAGADKYCAGIDFIDINHGWAAGWWGGILYTNDGGEHWQLKKQVNDAFWDVASADSNSCIALTSSEVYRTIDGGATWNVSSPSALQHNSENVVAVMQGTTNPDTVIIVGAHYDSRSEDAYNYAPGADDNASGIAGIVEIARILSHYGSKYTLEFIGFSAEEQGLYGSQHYVVNAKSSGKKIKAMINLDMIAYTETPNWTVRLQSDEKSAWLIELASTMATTYTNLIPYSVLQSGGRSDHYWFQKKGYTTLSVSDGIPSDNPNYHTTFDDFSTLTIPFEVEIIKMGLATLANLIQLDVVDVKDDYVSDIKPVSYSLYQNYPNPFNPNTTIDYSLPNESDVTITIYDMLGKKINQLISQKQPSGKHSIQWNRKDIDGNPVSAGIYLYQIQAGDFVQTKKMVLMK